ncbi:hypothetical protein HDV04_005845 [Boothiomyces sp. JEL0838]|nr:hypothetical protein HDV04_005845 [Boothiomyces sp. JEL0838]
MNRLKAQLRALSTAEIRQKEIPYFKDKHLTFKHYLENKNQYTGKNIRELIKQCRRIPSPKYYRQYLSHIKNDLKDSETLKLVDLLLLKWELNGHLKAEEMALKLPNLSFIPEYILDIYVSCVGPTEALNWMYSLLETKQFQWDCGMCKKMTFELTNIQRYDLLVQFIEKMQEIGIAVDTSIWNNLLLGHLKNADLEKAESTYKAMIKNNTKPDLKTFELLIRCTLVHASRMNLNRTIYRGRKYIQKGLFKTESDAMDKVNSYLDLMKKYDLQPTEAVHSSLISFFTERRNYQRVLEYWKENNIKLDLKLYSYIFTALFKLGKLQQAQELLEDLLATSRPTPALYSVLMAGFSEFKKYPIVISLFQQYLEDGYYPHLRTYTILIDMYCKMGDLGTASKLWDQMVDQGIKPTELQYSVFLNGCCLAKEFEFAENIFSVMKRDNIIPSAASYNPLISGYIKHQQYDAAIRAYEQMIKQNVKPDYITFNILITLYSTLNNEARMIECLNNYISAGFSISDYTINPIVKYYLRNEQPDIAEEFTKLLEKATANQSHLNPNPVITETMKIDLANRNDEKIKLIRKVGSHNKYVADLILKLFDKQHPFLAKRVMRFFNQLEVDHKDSHIYHTYIKIMIKHDCIYLARSAILEMKRQGFLPEPWLAELLQSNGNLGLQYLFRK